MLPWEKEVYVGMLIQWLKEENDKAKQQNKSSF